MIYFFFFSSRRRHTRYWRDWSSDVCSSDLRGRPAVELRDPRRGSRPFRVATRPGSGPGASGAEPPGGVRDEARRGTVVRGDGGPAGDHRGSPEDARSPSTRGAPGTARGEIRLMVDNLNPDGGRGRARASEPSNHHPESLADREVALNGDGHPALVVQQWLDGEASEATARRTSGREVEFWS